MDTLLSPFRQSRLLNTIFLANALISFHYALIIYLNSSLLSGFFTQTQVSALYIIASIIDTILLLNASKITEKFGIYKFTVSLISLELFATVGMAVAWSQASAAIFFVCHTIAISLLFFNMDIFVEGLCEDESKTGSIRATYLTMSNLTTILGPIVVALLLIHNDYSLVYSAGALLVIPMFFLMRRFKKTNEKPVAPVDLKQTILEYIKNKDLYNVFVGDFLLQFFYGYMVIYTPIYLRRYVGFSWPEIGIMFTIMLLPFVMFELPVGQAEDREYGEKEFLTIGFIIMGLSTLFLSFITAKNFWMWTIALFITRIGASFVEVSSESYFFKRVNQEKTDVISFFRVTRPIAFIAAPILATLALEFMPFQYVFIVIGALMILGAHFALALTDTK